eukprot:TRINITY_DN183_c0_g1_i2.p1 TRINITY_DN183_c0_g1~~TRINITY_DN183_c0_g1_i2.p1  ORF type:complete len:428 (+),score=55.07 TRINITY_DN183_c0_g1_i2:65-1348(+)
MSLIRVKNVIKKRTHFFVMALLTKIPFRQVIATVFDHAPLSENIPRVIRDSRLVNVLVRCGRSLPNCGANHLIWQYIRERKHDKLDPWDTLASPLTRGSSPEHRKISFRVVPYKIAFNQPWKEHFRGLTRQHKSSSSTTKFKLDPEVFYPFDAFYDDYLVNQPLHEKEERVKRYLECLAFAFRIATQTRDLPKRSQQLFAAHLQAVDTRMRDLVASKKEKSTPEETTEVLPAQQAPARLVSVQHVSPARQASPDINSMAQDFFMVESTPPPPKTVFFSFTPEDGSETPIRQIAQEMSALQNREWKEINTDSLSQLSVDDLVFYFHIRNDARGNTDAVNQGTAPIFNTGANCVVMILTPVFPTGQEAEQPSSVSIKSCIGPKEIILEGNVLKVRNPIGYQVTTEFMSKISSELDRTVKIFDQTLIKQK